MVGYHNDINYRPGTKCAQRICRRGELAHARLTPPITGRSVVRLSKRRVCHSTRHGLIWMAVWAKEIGILKLTGRSTMARMDGQSQPSMDRLQAMPIRPAGIASIDTRSSRGLSADRSPSGETGAPACYTGGAISDLPDRRILHAAIINCLSLGLAGSAQSDVPVAAFGKFFLTLPLQRSQTDLYVEAVGLVRPGDSVNYDMVQLYR